MMHCRLRLGLLYLLGGAALSWGLVGTEALSHSGQQQNDTTADQPQKKPVDEQTIKALIDQLGDEAFDKREAAEKRLIEIGPAAMLLVRKAAKENPDAEIRQRASNVLRDLGSENCLLERRFDKNVSDNKKQITRLALSPDGGFVYAVGAGPPHVWDIKTGKEAFAFDKRPGQPCVCLTISGDGLRLLTGCAGGSAHLYEAKTGKKLREFAGHPGGVWGVAVLPDGKRMIAAGLDIPMRIWNMETGLLVRTFESASDKVKCLALSPDGKLLAGGHFSKANGPGTMRLWDVEKAVEVRSMPGHKLEISSVAFSPDGKTILSSSYDKTMALWEVATGKELKRFLGHDGPVEAAEFTPDGTRIISCSRGNDQTMRLWNVETATQIAEGPRGDGGFSSVAVLPDGKRCVTLDGLNAICLWRWVK